MTQQHRRPTEAELSILRVLWSKGPSTVRQVVSQPEEKTQRQLVDDLLDRAFGGSVQKLVLQALSGSKPSREELTELRKLLNTLDTRRP
jgi:BlaI family penicillinase repressor